ncbi:MAG: spore maturation protein [Alphaproteobacteria bacterium]|nr:spore maturation protein [Alphaproteobacteria bacterium]
MRALQDAILARAKASVDLVIGLIGAMAFFLGLMRVAQDGGLLRVLSRVIRPLLVRLFPDVPPDHPAMGAMVLNLAANALGLGNAATPFGIKAMKELDALNPHKGTATNAMVLFLAINTSSVTLLPTGVIVWRETLGSARAADIMPTTLLATLFSTSVAILAAKTFQRFARSPADVTPPDEVEVLPEAATEAVDEGYPAWVSWLSLAAVVAAVPLTVVYGTVVAPWIIPGLAFGMIAYGTVQGVPVYESFVAGAREGWDLAVRIIPYLVAILVAVGMLQASGALDVVIGVLDPVTSRLGLPGAALPMALLRPLSGSGALGVMVATMQDPATGPDTYVGFLVSTLQGSTETTFYVLAVYFGAVGVKRVRHALAAALTADAAGILGAVVACSAYFAWAL